MKDRDASIVLSRISPFGTIFRPFERGSYDFLAVVVYYASPYQAARMTRYEVKIATNCNERDVISDQDSGSFDM